MGYNGRGIGHKGCQVIQVVETHGRASQPVD